MWSLYEDEKELLPLVFSNGKSQADVVKEIIDSVNQGNNIIFLKGIMGTGKSAIALNLARHFGKTSIVVPIKSLQEQYLNDYSGKKYLMHNGRKLKISSIVGRQNFKCRFLEQGSISSEDFNTNKERNLKLSDIFSGKISAKAESSKKETSCDNDFLPCKIEIREKNLPTIKKYIHQNPNVSITDFESVKDIKRMTIAPVCPYWSPIISEEFEIHRFKDAEKLSYKGLLNKKFIIYFREKGCPYYEQYRSYVDSDVIIFNSLKYKIENLMLRKPETELEVIDECDEFLDSLANEEQININRLLFSLGFTFSSDEDNKKILEKLTDISNAIKLKYSEVNKQDEIFELKGSLVQELLETILLNSNLTNEIELDESNYLFHLEEVARIFSEFFSETFFSIEKKDNNLIINLVTTNLEKRLKELISRNKIFVFMSGTIHSENVLKNIFGIESFKVIEAEVEYQGELIKCKNGYELDCSYESFKSNRTTREAYLKALSKSITLAKQPVLVHVNSFSDLPTENERDRYELNNLPTQSELIEQQKHDPLGKRVEDFKKKKFPILFTTKCSRGIDFPGDICNSIIITRFPYPNISSIFWKILKRNKPIHFMPFYMDKSRRELLQRIYRGLRSKNDKLYLLSPDIRVMDFEMK